MERCQIKTNAPKNRGISYLLSKLAGGEGFEPTSGRSEGLRLGRFQEVKLALADRRRWWLLGAVAVNLAVNSTPGFWPEEAPCIAA